MHINSDGSATEVQFVNKTSNDENFKTAVAENQQIDDTEEEQVVQIGQSDMKHSKKKSSKSLLTKMKNIFHRK